jgi:hypothetical protein
MLRKVLGVQWSDHMLNTTLYGTIPRCSTIIFKRRLTFVAHLIRENSFAAGLVCKTSGVKKIGKPHLSYGSALSSRVGFISDNQRCER